MLTLGFSLYPEKYDLKHSLDYIDLLARYGAKRLFMSLLQLSDGMDDYGQLYQAIIAYANQQGIRVIADVSPAFLEANGWQDCLIEKCREFGLAGLRLDEALPLADMVTLTHHSYGIKIELNMSTDKRLLTDLIAAGADLSNLIACHNFYPHEFTGLSRSHFLEMSRFYHERGIETAVFLSSNTALEGPWPVTEGLPTLEEIRHAPLTVQAEVMKATGLFDTVLISNQFIAETELASLVEVLGQDSVGLTYEPLVELTDIEQKVLAFPHRYRGDVSDFVIRSTEPRVQYQEATVPVRLQSKAVTRGTIVIDNDAYLRYKGEVQIALKSFTMTDKTNIVAQLTPWSLLILDYLQPWQAFRLVEEINPL
ncbi:DUF871 family protein [Streptococcus sp. zg-86]|uniref:DUF871 family protein n=1 Tax=Streptococcus zhangguiae TaxID=2664091 RepID=A0A6I4RJU6_9STRE|nr:MULTISPECIES: MupG family TIM beta-alpha barrel fold protein [unclassified Streptococcus]MTB64846.1 DUF871 family protein [Streptococcus sp. zg-86]MTB91084.1 DUF871 family protein [Streptococcus sp. zg-36]MWV56833.1 DUF871 family protein [Streptococcus sp. zg-70]QTH48361.1 DUF871 domain-containing protein [Streptococcus sp. zg-86]